MLDDDENQLFPLRDDPEIDVDAPEPQELGAEFWQDEARYHRKESYRLAAMLRAHRNLQFEQRDRILHLLDTKWTKMTEETQKDVLRRIRAAMNNELRMLRAEINAVLDQAGVPHRMHTPAFAVRRTHG